MTGFFLCNEIYAFSAGNILQNLTGFRNLLGLSDVHWLTFHSVFSEEINVYFLFLRSKGFLKISSSCLPLISIFRCSKFKAIFLIKRSLSFSFQ